MSKLLHSRSLPAQAGFTLIEMVISIVLLGIVGAVIAVFIRSPIQSYFDTASRVALTDAADGAIRRLTRDAQSALPNSFRATGSASGASSPCVEFLPTVAAGRYRAKPNSSGGGNILDFASTDTSFDVLSQVGLGSLSGSNLVAIYNLGISGADAYAGQTTATIASATASSITLSPGKKFPFSSPGNRFFVIPASSVVYSCAGVSPNITLYRSSNAISSTALATCPSSGTALVSNVSSCSFTYTPAVTTRNGALAISLELTLNNETVRLYQEVMVNNVP
jgi:MSHA biogenesis protein MshO